MKKLKLKNSESIFITNPENIFYLSGVNCSIYTFVQSVFDPEVFLLVTPKQNFILADSRHSGVVAGVKGFEAIQLPYPTTPENLAKLINKLTKGVKTIAFEEENFIYAELKDLKKSLNAKVKDGSSLIKNERVIKSDAEIKLLKKAAKITSDGFEYALSILKSGMTEKELASEITQYFAKNADGCGFSPIVAFGAGSAIPHYETSNKKIQGSGILLIDLGCKYKGYCGDMTRTVYIGKAPEKFKVIYNSVLAAQESCLKDIRAGMTAKEADQLARNSFDSKLRKYFTHGTGHGLGIAIHEDPRIRANNQILQDGMVFTIEPGLYMPGFGGVRIEDVVFLKSGKSVNITTADKRLREIRL